jgi:hypothetical protein
MEGEGEFQAETKGGRRRGRSLIRNNHATCNKEKVKTRYVRKYYPLSLIPYPLKKLPHYILIEY